jgi:hypothetical protein
MKEVSATICLRYLTRHWKKRTPREKADRLRQFLRHHYRGEWEFKKGELVRRKGEPHRTARANLNKANKAKSDKAKLKRLLEKQRKREENQRQKETTDRAWEKLDKPKVSRPYI